MALLRAVHYARVSTDAQAKEGYSIPEQLEIERAYSKEHGFLVVGEFSDDFTGRIIRRPGLDQVRALAEEGAFDVLVCAELDRLSRDNALGEVFLDWLAVRGIETRFVKQHFEPTMEGEFGRSVIWAVAKYESRKIVKRTSDGRHRKAREGKVPSKASPFGYRLVTRAEALALPEFAGRDGELLVVPDHAAVVRLLFERFAGGESIRGLVNHLNETGVPAPGGGLWGYSTVLRILTRETYAGRFFYGQQAHQQSTELTRHGNPRRISRDKPREEWTEIQVPVIVDEELFRRVQERLASSDRQPRGRPSVDWLLTGVVFCGDCPPGSNGEPRKCSGSRASKHTERKSYHYRRYVCNSRVKPKKYLNGWCGVDFSAKRLEEMAFDALQRALQPGQLARLMREQVERRLAGLGDVGERVADLEKQLQALAQQERKVAEMFLAGFSRELVQEKLQGIQTRRTELTGALAAAQAQLSRGDEARSAAEEAEALAAGIRRHLDASSAEERPELLKEIYRGLFRVTISKEREPEIEIVARRGLSFPWLEGR